MRYGAQLRCANVTCLGNASAGSPLAVGERALCTNTSDGTFGNGGLYNGMIAPLVNTSLKGFLW